MASTDINPPEVSLEAIVERIIVFRQITPIDQELLESAIQSKDYFSQHENFLLAQLYEGIKNGSIWVVK